MLQKTILGTVCWVLSAAAQTAVPAGFAPTSPGTGTMSGTVVDETGKAVAGATVSVAAELPTAVKGQKPAAFTPFRALSVTGKTGGWSVTNLPAGLFKICVQVPNSDYLEVCRWPLPATTATLTAGQTATVPAIALSKGYRLNIRLNDTGGILPKTATATQWPGLNLGVFTDNHLFVEAQRTGNDSTGFNYQVLVPFGVSLHAAASSQVLSLQDGAGNAADPLHGVVVPVMVPNGKTVPTVTFAVAGIKK